MEVTNEFEAGVKSILASIRQKHKHIGQYVGHYLAEPNFYVELSNGYITIYRELARDNNGVSLSIIDAMANTFKSK